MLETPKREDLPERKGGDGDTLKFHYKREERLKKLRLQQPEAELRRQPFLFKKGRRRGAVFLIDLLLVVLVIYLVTKPSNLYVQQKKEGVSYELNVTALKGKRTLVGFTLRNEKQEEMFFSEAVPVLLRIRGKSGGERSYTGFMEKGSHLLPRESSSVVFLLDESELPGLGILELYYGDSREPLFRRNLRF
jgi:hypothetical protein